MAVNSIAGDVAVTALRPANTVVSLDRPVVGAHSTGAQSLHQTVRPIAADANVNNKISSVNGQFPDAGGSHGKPVREMDQVVEVYNPQGKVRIKFVDSYNDVIYQIPAEMVAKMEDLMMKPETSASTKG